MTPRIYKAILAGVAILLMVVVSFAQRELARDRDTLGLTRYTKLQGAPPVLQLTTIALGGFRGLISNALWIRASELQDNDKYFEMVQLADWITKLEPHFTQVWLNQAWNMAYNISVKFKDAPDRWRWVERGTELLRDQGLQYNPNDVLMYRELAWFFQHKMGQNLDDAHMYYKQMWANEMSKVFGMDHPNWDELINPKTPDQKERAALLRDKYKMDPVFMKEVDEKYGPLEWRLPDASAIYWAAQGLAHAKADDRRIDPNDLITLRRVIYQTMQMTFQRGRLVANTADKQFEFGPNLDIIPKVSAAYEQAMEDDPKNRDHIETAHRNFLRDAVFFLYTYNRQQDAINWFKYLCKRYPEKALLDSQPKTLPGTLSLDEYAVGRMNEELKDRGHDKTELMLEGMLRKAYQSLAVGDDDEYVGLNNLAQRVRESYEEKIGNSKSSQERLHIDPIPKIKQIVLDRLLNGELSPELAAQLRTKLNMKAATPKTISTNSPADEPAINSTNTPATGTTNQ